MSEDYYQILGVSHAASQEEIKRAFHRLARKYHPDVAGPNARHEDHFKKITESYQTLSDPDLRRHYDIRRMVQFSNPLKSPVKDTVDFAFQSFSDFLNDILFKEQRKSQQQAQTGKHIETSLAISFVDAYLGGTYPINIKLPRTCEPCKGKGWPPKSPPQKCPECKGARMRVAKGPIPFRRSCKRCNGAGEIQMHTCQTCQGTCLVDVAEKIEVSIPAGADQGTRLRLTQKGASGRFGGDNGDLIVVLSVLPDARFTRQGDDLHVTSEINISELLLGAKIRVNVPGGDIMMNVPAGSELTQAFRLKNKGFASLQNSSRGDLYVSLQLRIPQYISEPAQKLIRQIAQIVPGF